MGESIDMASPEPDNSDFSMGFNERMHKHKLAMGNECDCSHCEISEAA
jgi:hypothetical protein